MMKRFFILSIALLIATATIAAADFSQFQRSYDEKAASSASADAGLSAEEKAILKAEFAKEGQDLDFNADGSMTIKNRETGEIVILNADGTIKGIDSSGNSFEFGMSDKWPSNDYTKQLPNPEGYGIRIITVTTATDGLIANIDCTVDQAKKYASALKAKGFDKDVEEEDQSMPEYGIAAYTFEAENGNGYNVVVTVVSAYGNKQCVIGLSRD